MAGGTFKPGAGVFEPGEWSKQLGAGEEGRKSYDYTNAADLQGDYSEQAAAERKRRRQEEYSRRVEGGSGPAELEYFSPGSATYGGVGGAEMYKRLAREGMTENDDAQARTQAGLAGSLASAYADRGPMATENAALAAREATTRGDQLGALGLNMKAAMGQAPSEARYQTELGMNQALANYASGAGAARGGAAMAGAQLAGGQQAGITAGEVGTQGGMARGEEIAKELAQYGTLAGQVRGQDLTRLGMANQMSQFNADLNDKWKLDQMGLAAGYGGLGVQQGAQDMGWFAESMKPEDIQFQMDQEVAGWEAGANVDRAMLEAQKSKEDQAQTQAMAGQIAQVALTTIGSMAGPAGAALGGLAGGAINSATRKFY